MSVPRLVRLPLALFASAIAVAACAGDSATGPTALFNATLVERFESEIPTSQPLHGGQLLAIIERLAAGAPVGGGRLVIDGNEARFSFVAEYDVRVPFIGVPDSALSIFAWSGRDADTIVEFQSVANDGVVVLMTDATTLDVNADAPSWAVKASRPGRKCGGFFDRSARNTDRPEHQLPYRDRIHLGDCGARWSRPAHGASRVARATHCGDSGGIFPTMTSRQDPLRVHLPVTVINSVRRATRGR